MVFPQENLHVHKIPRLGGGGYFGFGGGGGSADGAGIFLREKKLSVCGEQFG